ncbi:MAG: nickel pincer cofactor biosynthesis protein LarC [Thermomicrobiales bacterium]
MRIAYFDPFSGASGDMILGALVDAGLALDDLRAALAPLRLAGYTLRAERTEQHSIGGTRVIVDVTDDAPARTWRDIRGMIEGAAVAPPVKAQALAIFTRLATVEASIHGTPVEDVHFHEVGGIDAIVDICGACAGLHMLGVGQVFVGPLPLGSGFVRTAHGLLPVPAPATAALIAEAKAPATQGTPGGSDHSGELLTPTGAAILTTIGSFKRLAFTPSRVGYGFGTRELPWPNALRLWLGEIPDRTTEPAPEPESGEILLETNIDDMSPQHMELLLERVFAVGALDAWLTPITMKKGRPATLVSVLAAASDRARLEDIVIRNTTTLGIRATPVDRTKAARRIETVETRWGEVRVKLRGWEGRVIDVAPEYDDCLEIARAADVTLRDVWNEAHRLADVYIGRRLSATGGLLVLDRGCDH